MSLSRDELNDVLLALKDKVLPFLQSDIRFDTSAEMTVSAIDDASHKLQFVASVLRDLKISEDYGGDLCCDVVRSGIDTLSPEGARRISELSEAIVNDWSKICSPDFVSLQLHAYPHKAAAEIDQAFQAFDKNVSALDAELTLLFRER